MGTFRVSRSFTVESGHMLSRHPESCKFPHGHTRTITVVVTGNEVDENGMLVDFKALKLALKPYLDRYDHSIAVNSKDPFLPALQAQYPPEAVVIFDNEEPSTENIAKEIYGYVARVLNMGFVEGPYVIPPGRVKLERVRVSETPSTWAEYAE
jgi:6-pyruvoyltetrahydropterin/6-carboxytetrahydropterin synthase